MAGLILFAGEPYTAMAAAIEAGWRAIARGEFHALRFDNGELHMAINTPVSGQHCAILGSIAPPDERLLSMLLLAHTLKKERARHVTAIFPYLAYARDDKDKTGQSLATAWIGALSQASGIDEILTVDLHSEKARDLFPIPVRSLSPAYLFAEAIRGYGLQDATMVAPDNGAVARCESVREAAGMPAAGIVCFQKRRTAGGIKHTSLTGKAGRRVVIVDDILDTGSTLVSACEKLQKMGVEEISILVTHALFTGDLWKALPQFGVKRIFCTDTVQPPCGAAWDAIVRLPVVPLIEPELGKLLASASCLQRVCI